MKSNELIPATNLAETQRMQPPQPQPAVTTTTSPRFGDSILDVAVRVEQQKLFSIAGNVCIIDFGADTDDGNGIFTRCTQQLIFQERVIMS
ncbi:unnamed protein product [Onchocerca flexuosa]|uniref:Uncharacterized protein n=1 Tax=Onchocerca flexuosa TaxID=387005 RepID=A0A183HF76_9BILA|nr:unnamed protein product [Onchocerca flexuosa]